MVDDVVVCCVCEKEFKKITQSHLKAKHSMTMECYISLFPDAVLVNNALREISSKIGKRNKGRQSWCKGIKMSDDFRRKIRESHWARKPIEETIEIRKKMSENGRATMDFLNKSGKAFRMPKGYHTEEHKDRMRQLMIGRNVTWSQRIKETHWTKKNSEEVQFIIDKIQQNGTSKNTKRGWYRSSKMNENFFFMSSYEETRMKFLDSQDSVKSFTNKHGIWIEYEYKGEIHRYNPDFLITFIDGTSRIEEIKGSLHDLERIQRKESACLEYASSKGYQYRMIFKKDLEVL
jgi:hypothetical protein